LNISAATVEDEIVHVHSSTKISVRGTRLIVDQAQFEEKRRPMARLWRDDVLILNDT
jgi:hypothetical protein